MSWNCSAMPSLGMKDNVELCLTDRGKHTLGLNHYLWPWRNSRPEALPKGTLYHTRLSRSRPSSWSSGWENRRHTTGVRDKATLQDALSGQTLKSRGRPQSVKVGTREGMWFRSQEERPHASSPGGEPGSGEELHGQATNNLAKCLSYLDMNTALCPPPCF